MNSLGVRLALRLSAALFLLMLLSGVWLENRLTDLIHDEEITQAETHAKTMLASLRTLMVHGQGTLAREWLDRMRGAEGVVDIQIMRQDGQEAFTDLNTVNAVNAYLQRPRFSREPVPPRNTATPDPSKFRDALHGKTTIDNAGSDAITVLMPIQSSTECLGCHGYDLSAQRGVLKLSLSSENRERRLTAMRQNLWMVSGLLVGLLGIAVLFVLRESLLRPLGVLRDAITRVGEGDRSARLPAKWRDELGEVARVFNRMQTQLFATETRIRSVMDSLAEAVITIDEKGEIESTNPAAERIFGYEPDELIGKNVCVLMPEPYRSQHDGYLANFVRTGRGNILGKGGVELIAQRKNGESFPVELTLSEMRLESGRFFVGVLRDITERKQQSAALEYQALHDALTDLPNRVLLTDRLRQAILRAQRNSEQFAFLLMDLDHFKQINDTLGHQYGDRILQQVAKRVRESLRESDTVARLGGDEFAVLLTRSDLTHASEVAGKLLKLLERPFLVDGQALHVGASIGIALYPSHGQDEMTLMRLADVAMYVAKRGSRGFAIYDIATDEHNPRNLTLLGELRSAIDLDELVLYYQPKIDLSTRKINGVEALVRWKHPQHGLMPPDEFIPLAEHAALIAPLTLWVVNAALAQAARWHRRGLALHIAINLSAQTLHDTKLADDICRALLGNPDIAANVTLEVTEGTLMIDPLAANRMLTDFRTMGAKIAVDDFGTGYSSLAYLKKLPLDELKIDRSFVKNMASDRDDMMIVRSIVDLGHNLGLRVVAEGVEDQAACESLAAMDCNMAQGYFLGNPMNSDNFDLWLKNSAWAPKPR
mgnify:CR=1 FL=1